MTPRTTGGASPSTPRGDGFPQTGWAWAIEILRERFGLVFPQSRLRDVEQAMHSAMERRGITDPARWRDVVTEGTEPIEDVIAQLTIGETYFFRDPAQLDVVRDVVIPEARAVPERPLRIWSAGCATGEEPYSLAMLLLEADWKPAEHPVHIVGTDLSVVRLAAARRGQYGAWALRGMTEQRRARFFEQRGRQWLLDPAIRSMVEFRLLNLAEDAYPEPATGIFGMDIIFCRNVLIYFDMHTVKMVAERLINSLSEDGWLFIGASDPPLGDLIPCEVVTTSAGLAYRRPERRASHVAPSSGDVRSRQTQPDTYRRVVSHPDPTARSEPQRVASSVASPKGKPAEGKFDRQVLRPATAPRIAAAIPAEDVAPALVAYAEGRYGEAAELASESIRRGAAEESIWLVWVRSIANEGRLLEAASICATALDRYGSSAELAYMESVLLAQSGLYAESAAGARRALYLDRSLVVAHMALGDALSHTGDSAGAARSFRNAERILSRLDPDSTVRGTDGETADRLTQIARFRIGALKDIVT